MCSLPPSLPPRGAHVCLRMCSLPPSLPPRDVHVCVHVQPSTLPAPPPLFGRMEVQELNMMVDDMYSMRYAHSGRRVGQCLGLQGGQVGIRTCRTAGRHLGVLGERAGGDEAGNLLLKIHFIECQPAATTRESSSTPTLHPPCVAHLLQPPVRAAAPQPSSHPVSPTCIHPAHTTLFSHQPPPGP